MLASWHLSLGGRNRPFHLNSVELYNWRTGVKCFIEPLPQVNLFRFFLEHQPKFNCLIREWHYHSVVLMNGDPVVCGGRNETDDEVKCFHYERGTKTWKRVTDKNLNFSKNKNHS